MLGRFQESSLEHAVSGHGIHFYKVDRDLAMEHFWTETGRSPAELKVLLDLGAVYLNSERLSSETDLKSNDIVRIHTEPKRYHLPAGSPDHLIVYESEQYVVLNKPSGIPVHPTLDNQIENCVSWLSRARGTAFRVTNRIDVGTEGLIAFAKNERAQRIFMTQIQNNRIEKSYSAVCNGPLMVGQLEHWMEPSAYAPKTLSDVPSPEWKHCRSEIVGTSDCGKFTECLLRLLTGRTHQLRAQLAAVKAPILGDKMYGSTVRFHNPRSWALRSNGLTFRDEEQIVRLELPRWSAMDIQGRLSDIANLD